MHIDRPKALHGFKEFLREIFVVVIGILIALSLEEAVHALHDRAAEQRARQAIYGEIGHNISLMKARLATHTCVERRLDEIGTLLANAGDGPLSPQPRWIGQPPYFFMANERWLATAGSGSASLFSTDQQRRLGNLYDLFAAFNDSVSKEQDAWAQLRGLESWTGPLGPVGRVHFLSALQTARIALWALRANAGLAFPRAQAFDIHGAEDEYKGRIVPHATCLPIETPREKALKLLQSGDQTFGQPN